MKFKAKELRKNSTIAEAYLWKHLSKKQLNGFTFHRQKPLGNFIVDFYCTKLKLAIEIDGYSHDDNQIYDCNRQAALEKNGVHFLRFSDTEVRRKVETVLARIKTKVKEIQRY